MGAIIEPDEIAALTRALAEAAGAARRLRVKLDGSPGPLATLAQLRIGRIEDSIETDLDSLATAAPLLLAVSGRDGTPTDS